MILRVTASGTFSGSIEIPNDILDEIKNTKDVGILKDFITDYVSENMDVDESSLLYDFDISDLEDEDEISNDPNQLFF